LNPTTIRYLLDTNTASYLAKDTVPSVRRQFQRVRAASVGISVVSEAELLFRLARKPEAKHIAIAVREFLSRITILAWDSKAAYHYAQLRAMLEREGKSLGGMDMMIAAHAVAEDAVLVSNDSAFSRIGHLKTEDWTAS
jgi:tRNA(fMet)-specific endonuclease VapC